MQVARNRRWSVGGTTRPGEDRPETEESARSVHCDPPLPTPFQTCFISCRGCYPAIRLASNHHKARFLDHGAHFHNLIWDDLLMIQRALLLCAAAAPLSAGELYFPSAKDSEWKKIQPADARWNRQALDDVLSFAGSRRSTAVVILLDGRILAEKQWDPASFSASSRFALERAPDGQILEVGASFITKEQRDQFERISALLLPNWR